MLWNRFQLLPVDLLHVGEPPCGLSGPCGKLSTTVMQRMLASKKTVGLARCTQASIRFHGSRRKKAGWLRQDLNRAESSARFFSNRVIEKGLITFAAIRPLALPTFREIGRASCRERV